MADPLLALYRSDWTSWSLSGKVVGRSNRHLFAQLSHQLAADLRRRSGSLRLMGSLLSATRPAGYDDVVPEPEEATHRLLLAPGGRYRFELDHHDERRLIVSDGVSCWVIRDQQADQSVADLMHPPMGQLVRPTWLMRQLRLTATGTTEVAGRAAVQVRGTPRLPANRWSLVIALLHRVDIAIDAELGLVLRQEAVFDGQPLSSLEVTDLQINPSAGADPASFRPADGVAVEQNDIGPPQARLYWRGGDEPGDEIDKSRMALNIARGAVYLAAKRLARPERVTAGSSDGTEPDAEAEMPAGPGSRQPVSDATLRLIAHTGMPPLTLTVRVHHWLDGARARRSVPALGAGANMHEAPGANEFLGTEDDSVFQLRDWHRTARLTLARPDRYRIDFEREDRPRHPLMMACDGERLRKVYHNRVVTSPALPLPANFVRLVDPAWLLGDWPLSEDGAETIAGRKAIRLIAERPPARADRGSTWSDHAASIALAIDAELGIVLRQASYLDNMPVSRIELRDLQIHEAIDLAEFGRAIVAGLPEISTNGEPIGDLDLPWRTWFGKISGN